MVHEARQDVRDDFIDWQCRIRRHAMRRAEGRPSDGMRPRAKLADGSETQPIVTLMVRSNPGDTVAEFRHLVRKSHDPAERYKAALRLLQSNYYQYAQDFDGRLAALFGAASAVAARLTDEARCTLRFRQSGRAWALPCGVARVPPADPVYEATYWHNALFNPALPADVCVLVFTPDWTAADTDA